MPRSHFASFTDKSSCLYSHVENSYSLDDFVQSEQRSVLPSPPPSFYRIANARAESDTFTSNSGPLLSLVHSFPKSSEKSQHTEDSRKIAPSIMLRRSSSPQKNTETCFRDRNFKPDPLLVLNRRQKAIEADMQHLLDAQSIALLQGYERRTENLSEVSSRASTNDSLQRLNCPGVIPVRQPRIKAPGLRRARKGLITKMEELIEIKREELNIYDDEISIREEAVLVAKNWESKMIKLKERLGMCRSGKATEYWQEEGLNEKTLEIAQLEKEEKAVEIEIRQVEENLVQLKARQLWLRERINDHSNRLEAKLSSYRGALRNAESEIKEFLQTPPVPDSKIIKRGRSFNILPPNEKTLSSAMEWWDEEISQINFLKQEVEMERMALDEGILLWETCNRIITNFESNLREEIKSKNTYDEARINDQMSSMNLIIKKLEEYLHIAEDKGWNLLICAIGAELEAFREGRDIFEKVLNTSENKPHLETHQKFHSDKNESGTDLHEINGEDKRMNLELEMVESYATRIPSFLVNDKDSG